jgi:hypothetical protein
MAGIFDARGGAADGHVFNAAGIADFEKPGMESDQVAVVAERIARANPHCEAIRAGT